MNVVQVTSLVVKDHLVVDVPPISALQKFIEQRALKPKLARGQDPNGFFPTPGQGLSFPLTAAIHKRDEVVAEGLLLVGDVSAQDLGERSPHLLLKVPTFNRPVARAEALQRWSEQLARSCR